MRSLQKVDSEGNASQDRLLFKIDFHLDPHSVNRFIYEASTISTSGEHQRLFVKFTQKYGKELHLFCAKKNRAPKLLAFERLPGNWYGVAMEYISATTEHNIVASCLFPKKGKVWIDETDQLIEKMHAADFVHGDLRLPNFVVDEKHEQVLLVDFDWGGKENEVMFPRTSLLPEIRKDRDDRKITKAHDNHAWEETKKKLLEELEKVHGTE